MIKLDILEKQVKIVYLGIGSNLGKKKKNIEIAKLELLKKSINIIKSSGYYESLSWPYNNLPKFVNIVVKIKTSLNEVELLELCKDIERSMGRKNTYKNAPRICDIDILDYDNIINKINVNLPHPRMDKRNFVLIPLFEIDKNWKHPITKKHIKDLIFSLSKKDISSIKLI